MAESLRKTVPDLASRSTRDQALILNLWLRQLGFNGLSDRSNYRDLRNCLLGQALRHPDHETIPITSATIYCSIARRLGILADPWFNPGHVIVCVWPYPDRTLDGEEAQEGQKLTPMYLDPWGRDGEVPTDEVTPFAVPATWYSRTRKGLTHPVETVLRVHNNIQATNHAAENRFVHFESDLGQLLSGHSQMNLLAAQYASLWARIILADPQEFAFGNLPPYDKLTSLLVDDFPEDVTWAESMLGPMLQSNPELFPPNWKEKLEHAFTVARRRSANGESDDGDWRWDCELASGQVFRHKRNDNIGLIFRAKMPKTLPSTGKADFFECQ
jgi:F-box protein 21